MNLHLARWGAFATTLAATATFALGSASTASAALLAPCAGASPISGEGTTLEAVAQAVWTTRFNTNTNGGCTTPGSPRVRYTPTSSDQCIDIRWSGDGVSVFSTAVDYCAADRAPTASEISNINRGSRASLLTIPDKQFAVAILVNPPTGCTITSITPADLELVFRGSTRTWAGITGTSGCGTNRITRVVRADPGGSTYQLKHYLFTQNGANVCSGRIASWADLQAPNLNLVWPSVCDAYPSTGVSYSLAGGFGPGGGVGDLDEAKTVANTTGSIGYAALGDARSVYTGTGNYKWIPLRAGRISVDPSTNGLSTTTANANCTTATGAYGTSLPAATASWSGVYLVTPGTQYPLCALAYNLALTDYSRAWTGLPTGQSVATTVHDYLNYVNLTLGGVADLNNHDYASLPPNVQAAAATGISQIVD